MNDSTPFDQPFNSSEDNPGIPPPTFSQQFINSAKSTAPSPFTHVTSFIKNHRLILSISGIILLLLALFIILIFPNLTLKHISISIDETQARSITYDFFTGSSISLHPGDTLNYHIVADIPALIVFKDCTFDSDLINVSSNKITAKSPGTATLVCTSSFHPDRSSTLTIIITNAQD